MGLVLQRIGDLLYPPACVNCGVPTQEHGALCSGCRRETPFLSGLQCDLCGASLLGEADSTAEICDDCRALPRPWSKGRAALSYSAIARKIVLGLKHGDRIDLATPAARWLARAGKAVLPPDTLLVPVPIARSRLLLRRHNQAADLVVALSRTTGLDMVPEALVRVRPTESQGKMDVAARFANLEGAIAANPKYRDALKGRTVTIVDDVMASGATFSASTRAVQDAGATTVFVLMLARAEKTP